MRWLIDLRPFRQLEDFNSGPRDKDSEEYTKKYHEKMSRQRGQGRDPPYGKIDLCGCYRKEDQLPAEKIYGGGVVGASASAAFNHARSQRSHYVVVARSATTATRLRLILYRPARPSMMEGARDRAPTTTPSRRLRRRWLRRRRAVSRRGVCEGGRSTTSARRRSGGSAGRALSRRVTLDWWRADE